MTAEGLYAKWEVEEEPAEELELVGTRVDTGLELVDGLERGSGTISSSESESTL